MQSGVCGANDNSEWKWVWNYGGNAESVAKNRGCFGTRVLQHQTATTPECYSTKLLQRQTATAPDQSATAPNCYSTRVLLHQSGATSMTLFRWHTDAWVAVGRTQKVPEKKWKWWFWRNTNGDSGEIQTPEARGIRVRLGGNGGAEGKNWILLSGKSIWETSRGKKSPIIISSLSSALFFPPRGKMRRSRLNGLIRESEASLSSKRHKT